MQLISYTDAMTNPFLTETYYHVYNRAIGNEKAFLEEKNYHFFLQKIKDYLLPIADVYSYCLLPNHYHLLLYTKDETTIAAHKEALIKTEKLSGTFTTTEAFVLQQFSNMGNSYTKAFNKTYNRKGRLFMESLKRKIIDTELYFTKTIHYIHVNPVHHGLTKQLSQWPYCSYNAFTSNAPTLLQRDKVLEWFGNKQKFIAFHNETSIDIRCKFGDD
jgi:putative transposase